MQALVFQKIGDRITEQMFSTPQPEEPDDGDDGYAAEYVAPDPEIVMHDEDGRLLGTAKLVSDVHVYVIGDGYGTIQAELMQCLAEGSKEIRVMAERGRISALIYFPDPNRPTRTGQALRADDV